MPKFGRRSEATELDLQWNTPMLTMNAPFGTQYTPATRTKIIGGRRVTVFEDRKFPNSPRSDASFTHPLGGASPGRGSIPLSESQLKLAPLTEKPTEFNPLPFRKQFAQPNALPDVVPQPPSSNTRAGFSPHPIIPPIASPHPSSINSQPPPGNNLQRHLPALGYLPSQPIRMDKMEELALRQRIHRDLADFEARKLKDVYLELTGYDRHLTGYINYTDLGLVFMRHQVNISAENLRLVASMFVDETKDQGVVHYEKILSFIASSLKPVSLEEQQPTERFQNSGENIMSPQSSRDGGVFFNPVTHQEEDYSKNSSKFPFADRDSSKLLRLIEQQLLASEEAMDFDAMWQVFRSADRLHRGKMSKDQIKSLAYGCRIPLQESLLNQVIERCDASNGQYDWQQFLAFLERVQPSPTGLKIPESKRPTEYVKHYPVPTNNWPRDSDKIDGTPRESQSPRKPYDYLGRDDPKLYMGFDHPKFNRMSQQEAPLQPPARAGLKDSQDKLDEELDQLRKSYEKAKQHAFEENHQKQRKADWFDRFMKLAQALYDLDDGDTGQLPPDRVSWAVERFNDAYNLELPVSAVPNLLQQHSSRGRVSIDPFLKSLGAMAL